MFYEGYDKVDGMVLKKFKQMSEDDIQIQF